MGRALLIRLGVPVLGVAATLAAISDQDNTVAATAGIAVLACMATYWSATFAKHHGANAERAWTMWMLYPCLAAVLATLLARYAWSIWVVVALVVVALPTIAVHALFMGQRDRAGAAPESALAQIVAWLPVISSYAVLLVLLTAGVVELVR
jgi:hypothetical protein